MAQVKGYGALTLIDGGGFSSVYKAQELSSKRIFAIKILNPNTKSPDPNVSSYREIQALSVADHPNIVKLHEVVHSSFSVSLVMEYIPHNISRVLEKKALSEPLAKGFMVQLFRGLAHLHSLGIIHRDIKPQNLLVSKSGVLKICDLGICRLLPDRYSQAVKTSEENHAWTLQVGTHFYRAPELLYGDRTYGESVDMWAAGCVMAELLNGEPLFPGTGDIELLSLITNFLGSPSEKNWPGLTSLADYGKIGFKEKEAVDLNSAFPSWSSAAIDLISKLIVYNPAARIDARTALHHEWFSTEPAPTIAPFDGNTFDLLESTVI